MTFKYPYQNSRQIDMKKDRFDRDIDRLLKGRVKRLDNVNLAEELKFRENVSELTNIDGREVFGE